MTRQDIRGANMVSSQSGVYAINVKTPGHYRITCRLTDMLQETHLVTLKIGAVTLNKEILYAESQCRFDRVALTPGKTTLQASVNIDDKKQGFRFITIEKLY